MLGVPILVVVWSLVVVLVVVLIQLIVVVLLMGLDPIRFPVNVYLAYKRTKLRWIGHALRTGTSLILG